MKGAGLGFLGLGRERLVHDDVHGASEAGGGGDDSSAEPLGKSTLGAGENDVKFPDRRIGEQCPGREFQTDFGTRIAVLGALGVVHGGLVLGESGDACG